MTVYRNTDANLPANVKTLFDALTKRHDMEARVNPTTKLDPTKPLTVAGIANFAEADRWDEVMPPACWKKWLPRYLKNPVILREHDRSRPIGRAVNVEVKADGLYYEAVIGEPDKADLTQDQIDARSLLAQEILKTNSVGFVPHVIEYDEDQDVLRYIEVELLEISIVTIPMQQDSVITSVKSWRDVMSQGANTTKNQGGDGAANANATPEVKAMLEENTNLTRQCHEMLTKMSTTAADEAKALKAEIETLKSQLATEKAAREEVEKNADELLKKLQAAGVYKAA